jgi:hypothetical protein
VVDHKEQLHMHYIIQRKNLISLRIQGTFKKLGKRKELQIKD